MAFGTTRARCCRWCFLPHFWQTWWFKLSLLALFFLGLGALYRLRVARLRAIETLRVQIAANLHDDVGARLTKVAMVTEFLERETTNQDRVKPHVQTLTTTVREIIQAMDEIVWTINPQERHGWKTSPITSSSMPRIISSTPAFVAAWISRPNCPIAPSRPKPGTTSLWRLKRPLNNVLKHARANEVRIGLAVADNLVVLSIADDGVGFVVAEADPSGNGLDNMRHRLRDVGGRFALESQPGWGTLIKLEAEVG